MISEEESAVCEEYVNICSTRDAPRHTVWPVHRTGHGRSLKTVVTTLNLFSAGFETNRHCGSAMLAHVRFQLPMPVKKAFCWDIPPRILVDINGRFRGTCPHNTTSKHLRNVGQFYHTTQRSIPEDSHLYTCRCESLESYEID